MENEILTEEKPMNENPTIEEIERFVINSGSDSLAVFGGEFEGGVRSQQVPDEFAPCIYAIIESDIVVKSYLEIGVAAGGSTFLINHFFSPDKIVLIDDNQHPKASYRKYILVDVDHQLIAGWSTDLNVVEQVKQSGPYDLMLIDADHAYAAVKIDAALYLPMLRPGGFVIFHDSAYFPDDVGRVVSELKEDPGFEFIDNFISKVHAPCGMALFKKNES